MEFRLTEFANLFCLRQTVTLRIELHIYYLLRSTRTLYKSSRTFNSNINIYGLRKFYSKYPLFMYRMAIYIDLIYSNIL